MTGITPYSAGQRSVSVRLERQMPPLKGLVMSTAGPRWAMLLTLALVGAGAGASAAAAASRPSSAVRAYVVDGVRDSLDRAAIAATGAAIVEVDHASVVVTGSAADVRRLRALQRYPVNRRVVP